MGKDGLQLFGRDDFELGVGAVGGRFVRAPAAKLSHVAEAVALHVFVGNFDDEFGAQSYPGEILSGVPSALAAGHALGVCGVVVSTPGPGVVGGGVLAVRCEEGDQLPAPGHGEAGADADVLERADCVIEAKQEGADGGSFAAFVPAEAADNAVAVAVALVLDLEHGSLGGLV